MRVSMAGVAIIIASIFGGCGTGLTVTDGEPSARTVITADDIAAVLARSTTAHDMVRRLKPEWLRKRSPRTTMAVAEPKWDGDIQIYLNGQRMGGPPTLRNISAESVREVRYLNAAEAVRYGRGHQHGAIMVQTW